MTKVKKVRNYTFTINNYTKKMLKQFSKVAESLEKHQYICYGLEVAPETGTKHIQGYIQLSGSQGFVFLHNYFNLIKKGKVDKFHVEQSNGSLEQNQKYTKKDGEWTQFGAPKREGRNDLKLIKKEMKETPKELFRIIDERGNNFQQLKYAENLQKYYLLDRDINNPPKVFWLYGDTGIGKTRLVYESFDEVCSVSDFKWLGGQYSQEECYLLDDFREGDISFNMLLRITDRYPISLPMKNSSIKFNSPYIVITSPESIDLTFFNSHEDLQQLKRRIFAEINLDREKVKDLKKYKPNIIDKDEF